MVELVYRKTMATNTVGEDSLQGIIHDTVSTLLEQTNQSGCDQKRRNYTHTLSQAAVQHMEHTKGDRDPAVRRHSRLLLALNPSTWTPGFSFKSTPRNSWSKVTWDDKIFGASDHVFVAAVCLNLVPIVVDTLAENPKSVSSSFCFGRPLTAAAFFGHVELFTDILQGGLKKEKDTGLTRWLAPWDLLFCAARQGHETIVRYMYSRGDIFPSDTWPWHDAIIAAGEGGHVDVLRFLLNQNPDFLTMDYQASKLLWAGAHSGHLDIVNFVLETGLADIDRPLHASKYAYLCEGTPLEAAVSHGYHDVVRRLIQAGAKPTNKNGFFAITYATIQGRIDIVAMLWDAGVGEVVMAKEYLKKSLMSQASETGSEGVIRILEERGLTRAEGTNTF